MEPDQGTDQLTADYPPNYGFSIGEPIRQIDPLSAPGSLTSPPGRGADQREVGMSSVGRPNGHLYGSYHMDQP